MKYRVVVRLTKEMEVVVDAENEGDAVDQAITIGKHSKSAHDVVMCDVELVEPSPQRAA